MYIYIYIFSTPKKQTKTTKSLVSTLPTLNLRRCLTTLASGAVAVAFDEPHPIRPYKFDRPKFRGAMDWWKFPSEKFVFFEPKRRSNMAFWTCCWTCFFWSNKPPSFFLQKKTWKKRQTRMWHFYTRKGVVKWKGRMLGCSMAICCHKTGNFLL